MHTVCNGRVEVTLFSFYLTTTSTTQSDHHFYVSTKHIFLFSLELSRVLLVRSNLADRCAAVLEGAQMNQPSLTRAEV